jgi:hypothetical protein
MKPLHHLAVALTALLSASVFAESHGPVVVTPAVHQDRLPSLRNVVPQQDGYKRFHDRVEHDIPLPFVPAGQVDGALQNAAAPSVFAPTLISGVDGISDGFTGPQGTFTVQYAPPDTVGAIGATQFVQVVNVGLAVFDKATKTAVYGPVPTNTLWSGFGDQCETSNDGDAVVVYDKAADRWVVSQFAVSATPYLQCVAVSATNDATGAWYRYSFSYGSVFPDYPKMGVWPDAYYETFNMFNGNSFAGSQLCAYDRASMLTGAAATQQCFQLASSFGGVLPADLDGSTAPPAGAPNYLANFGSNSLNLWKFHVDWANTANTTLTGPTNIAVANFTAACNGGACVPQMGTSQKLDSLADRLMFRLAYRNFGDHESLVVNHAVTVGPKSNAYSGIRWYEIRNPGAAPTLFQQSTFTPDTNYRWMGSIAMDRQGNMALGYSVSSGSIHPQIHYTGRLVSEALNTMETEAALIDGAGSQTKSLNRWGDYSAMTVDPSDDCTFWYTTEYIASNGTFNWSTRIGSFKFPSCGAAATMSYTTQPAAASNIGAGSSIPFVVQVLDGSNAPVQGEHISLAVASGPGTLAGTTTAVSDASGNASFSVSLNVLGSYTLQATDTTTPSLVPIISNSFNIIAGTATSISFTVQPTSTVAGSAIAPAIVVHVHDAGGNPVSGDSIGLAIANNPGSATLSGGGAVATDSNGDATFSAVSLDKAGIGYTLSATDTSVGALATTSAAFNISAGAPASITLTAQPTSGSNIAAGAAIPLTAQVLDGFGNAVSGDNVTLTIGNNCCGATLSVTTNPVATDASGHAAFASVSLDKVGTGYTLVATEANALNATSNVFNIVAGAATQLVFTTQPSDVTQGGVVGTIAVTELDAGSNVVTSDSSTNVDFTVSACGGAVSVGQATMNNGVATLSTNSQRFYTVASGLQISASDASLSLAAGSDPFAVLANSDLLFSDGFDGCRL